MKEFKILLFFVLIVITSFISINVQASVLPSGIEKEQIGSKIDNYIEEHKDTTVGLQVLLYDENGIIYKKNYGYINKEDKIPVDDNSVFEWGSASKTFIWVSAMQLSEQGKLDLNKDIREYLPKNFLKLKYDKPITMLDLMNHKAGFEELSVGLMTDDKKKILSLEEALKKYQPDQIFVPGEISAYSNYGASLAAYIIQRVSGMDYAEYVKKNIFEKLDMNDTAIKADLSDNKSVLERRLQEYGYDTEGNRLNMPQMNYIILYPAGAGTGTMADFYKFASALIPGNNKLFQNEKTLLELYEPTSYYGKSNIHNVSHGFVWSFYKTDVVGHGGNTSNETANFQFDLDSKVGMLVMTNQMYESTYNADLYKLVFGDFKDNELAKTKREIPKGFARLSRNTFTGPLKILSGFYILGDELNTVWWVQEGKYIHAGTTDLKIETSIIVFELVLILLTLIGLLYSFITSISWIIHLFKKNDNHPFRKYNYLLVNEMSIIFIGLISVVVSFSIMQMNINENVMYLLFIFQFIMFIILFVSTIYTIYKLVKSEINEKKSEKVKYIFTIIFSILVLVFEIYFEIIKFWDI